jgi:hypothetical protein
MLKHQNNPKDYGDKKDSEIIAKNEKKIDEKLF